MKDEILACIERKHLKFLQSGQISKYIFPMKRKKAHDEGIPHLIVRIFLVAESPDNEILFLVQKRGPNKKEYPGYFTDTASGHVIFDENMDLEKIKSNAYRELEEEFGIKEEYVNQLNFYGFKIEKDQYTPEVAYLFIGSVDYNIELRPNPEELTIQESKFYSRAELTEIIEHEDAVDYSKEIWKELLDYDLKSLFQNSQKTGSEGAEKNTALFIGRFQPFHLGHLYVILKIYEEYDYLKIAIGSSQLDHTFNNPFTKKERRGFIKTTLLSNGIDDGMFTIYYIPDIFNANKWVDHVASIVGSFDIVFGSDWVRELFKKEGYDVVDKIKVYKDKKKYSGTNIRKLIKEGNDQWRSLVPEEVFGLLSQFNGVERIQKLSKKGEQND